MTVIKLTKTGNSVGFRLPKSELESLKASVGDKFELQVADGEVHMKKLTDHPRKGWFDNIHPIAAANEVDSMEKDFGNTSCENLDEYKWREAW